MRSLALKMQNNLKNEVAVVIILHRKWKKDNIKKKIILAKFEKAHF